MVLPGQNAIVCTKAPVAESRLKLTIGGAGGAIAAPARCRQTGPPLQGVAAMVQAATTVALTPNEPEDVVAAAIRAPPKAKAPAARHTTPVLIFKGHPHSVLVFNAPVYRRRVDQY